jgi:hypothetical protein
MVAEGDPCDCRYCPPDPNLSCSYTGDDVSVLWNYVSNAYRGDLLLCPGGDNGQIGGLLHQLDPPQHYSHMGIFVADHDLVRHCTAVPSRLTAEEYYSGSLLGVPVPADGLPADHVQFGWPGAITQSVEQAFYADRYASQDLLPPGETVPYRGADLTDLESASSPQKRYRIGALSFESAGGFPTLVVKPCPLLETELVTAALHRVADEVMKIYAHYRFYAYTDGAVAQDPNRWSMGSKVIDAMPDWDPTTHKWTDWTDPDEVKWLDVGRTAPAVCSSIVWQAVQNANDAPGAHARITLDWAEMETDALGEAGGGCRRALAPDWSGDTRDPYTVNGLFLYDEESRKRSASWLKDSMSDKVFNGLKDALHDGGGVQAAVATAINVVGRGAFIAAAASGSAALLGLLAPVVTPPVAAVLDAVFAEQLVELLYDMPNDIANQICNSFAFDCHRGFPGDTFCLDGQANPITSIDSTNFVDAPGPGRAVSPDNIHMFWDAPGPSDAKSLRGIYGFNQTANLVSAVVRVPVCKLVRSTGTATIRGQVTVNGRAVFGAYVEVACQHTVTRLDTGYAIVVRAGGQYKLIARYTDPQTGLSLYGENVTGKPGDPPIAAGSTIHLDIAVTEPPKCLRNVLVSGRIRIDDVYLTGADHDEQPYNATLFVQYGVASFDTDNGDWEIDPNDPAAAARHTDRFKATAGVGDAHGELVYEATANHDLSVDVTVTGKIANLTQSHTMHVPDGATDTIAEFSLDTGGPFNDRAYFRDITITNRATNSI